MNVALWCYEWDGWARYRAPTVKKSHMVLIIIGITKVLNVHDPMIGMMGALSWVTSFMVWALATQGWMMYMATGLSSIGIIMMMMMTKLNVRSHI